MQINRLFEIIYLLLDRGSMTAEALAEHFEVSKRTILRDIDALSAAKIPVYATRGRGGGISLLPGYVLDKSLITEEEQEQIIFALKSMAPVRGLEAGATLGRLEALFNKANTDWIDIDFSNWGSPASERQKFALVKQAVLTKRIIEIEYLNSFGQRTMRRIEPLRIIFKAHSWYLQAFCLTKEGYRIYKLSRIRGLKLCDEGFSRVWSEEIPFDSNRQEPYEATRLVLRFSPELAFRVYDEFDDEHITPLPDGSLRVVAYYPYDEWVVGHILSFGSGVTVLEPEFIRNEIAKRAAIIVEKYVGGLEKKE